jgi:hypothetical protein
MTFNLWLSPTYPGNWPNRRTPMIECLKTFSPDILCVQELHPIFHEMILEALPKHDFVRDEFIGWNHESNIYWDSNLFEKIDHGSIDIGLIETSQRLFWVLLKLKQSDHSVVKSNHDQKLLVSTAHFTWEGHSVECQNDVNIRKNQARQTVIALRELRLKIDEPTLPIFFMGDLNENYHPRRILREAGFFDCFSVLRLPVPPTHPQRPSDPNEDSLTDATLDWMMHNNYARPLLANVLRNFISTGGCSVSDHCPVMCIYEIGGGPYKSNLVSGLKSLRSMKSI